MKPECAADVVVSGSSSVYMVRPVTAEARDWIDENVATEGWQWFGTALAVEHRYVEALLCGMQEAGLVLEME